MNSDIQTVPVVYQPKDWVCYVLEDRIFSCQVVEYQNNNLMVVQRKIDNRMEEFTIDPDDCFFLVAP